MNEKYMLRFFFEIGTGTCLWSGNERAEKKFGLNVELDQLPLSFETQQKFDQLDEEFDTYLNPDYQIDPSLWRQTKCDKFNNAAHELYHQIVKELGDQYEVVNYFKDLQEDPDLDEYLKDPKNFKRK